MCFALAADDCALFLSRDGTLSYLGYCNHVLKRVPGVRFRDFAQLSENSYFIAQRLRPGEMVAPLSYVAALQPPTGTFSLQRVNHEIDEGAVQRDLSLYFADELLNIAWTIPSFVRQHRELKVCSLALGEYSDYQVRWRAQALHGCA